MRVHNVFASKATRNYRYLSHNEDAVTVAASALRVFIMHRHGNASSRMKHLTQLFSPERAARTIGYAPVPRTAVVPQRRRFYQEPPIQRDVRRPVRYQDHVASPCVIQSAAEKAVDGGHPSECQLLNALSMLPEIDCTQRRL